MLYKNLSITVAVSSVLIYLTFRLVEENINQVPCEDSCVRFCCESEENCNFNVTYLKEAGALNSKFKAITGLECKKSQFKIKNWSFTEVN